MGLVRAVPVTVAVVDPREVVGGQAPDMSGKTFVYDHLKRYYQRWKVPLTIKAEIVGTAFAITHGFAKLSIAKDLGHDRIDVLVEKRQLPHLRSQKLQGLIEVCERLSSTGNVVVGWHVMFFAQKLSSSDVTQILDTFTAFIGSRAPEFPSQNCEARGVAEWAYDDQAQCLEICFPTPTQDHRWAVEYLKLLKELSKVWPIETYQGNRLFAR